MSQARMVLILVVVQSLALLPCGCSKPALDPELGQEGRELGEIYDCYTAFFKRNDQPPRSPADFKEFDENQIFGLRALREGKYRVVWGQSAKDGGTVLAFAKDAPVLGGVVLMADGNIRRLTAEQFSAALAK